MTKEHSGAYEILVNLEQDKFGLKFFPLHDEEHEVSVYFSRTAFETFINSCRDALNNTQAL